MTTAEIALLLQARGFRFSKDLGQNFLMDEDVLLHIVELAEIRGRCVLEIGAGAGCLSKTLAPLVDKLLCVEIAGQLIPVLESVLRPYKNVRILRGDALKLDFSALCAEEFGQAFSVCANLPYGITSQILSILFRIPQAEEICVLLQKEAVDRLLSGPGSREYGPLNVLLRFLFEADVPLLVPPHCFFPQPHVDSAILRLSRKRNADMSIYAALEKLLTRSFSMRRKTILNNLSAVYEREQVQSALDMWGLSQNVRAEALGLDDFLHLAQSLSAI